MVIWISIFVIYFIFLLILFSGLARWRKDQQTGGATPVVAVVVAMRNEALNLETLIASLAHQNYKGKWELILVDDHSEDNTVQVAQILKHKFSQLIITIMQATGKGKKQALTAGIGQAIAEIIVTTDADCELPREWLTDMVRSFKPTTQLVAGSVCLKHNPVFFGKLQAVEFASVMATGLGMLGWNKPIMCNGASLAFKKSAFEAVAGYAGNEHIPTGDDEFLMRKISKRFPQSIRAIRFGNNSCKTRPAKSVNEFFEQRIRWASKWGANSPIGKLLAVLVLIFQIAWLPMVAIALFTQSPFLLAGVLAKIVLEGVLLAYTSTLIQQPFSLLAFVVLQIFYPPYVMIVALASQLVGYKWKGRTVLPDHNSH
ncbi:MAG: glycosyltransferase [Cyclobacteriaceae bacterium]|nr:glycosyltransferase [Cyclobacteriaceae bacterium]